jgi:hypothetical protein
MNRPFEVHLPVEPGHLRNVLFAIELIDAVTLSRVSQGIEVIADGLQCKPIVNSSGLFVWLKKASLQDDIASLRKIIVNPRTLPYESVEIGVEQLRLTPVAPPLTTIELSPRVDYAFAAGITGLRGTLIEEQVVPPQRPVPVRDAEVRLRWLDEDGVTWRDAPTTSTNDYGDFVSIVRLAPIDVPRLDGGALTVRLHAKRNAVGERQSADLKLLQGRVADPSALNDFKFAWDELQP